jgi:succinate dehydrogenase/fumarate reductase flavoprotein subunit
MRENSLAIQQEKLTLDGTMLKVYSANTLVIGSGAAGLNAAVQLISLGLRDVILVTERWGAGTSFNAGSDKQTYYKLSLAGSAPDSPRAMAEDLFRGGCMHGDIALCEAQHSAQAFYHLVSLGVTFPYDRYGAYVGYRTDHDVRGRATSAGPLTSRIMCECLGKAYQEAGGCVLDRHQVVALLSDRDEKDRKRVCGALAVDRDLEDEPALGFVLFNVRNVILATGGPGGMYGASVYPESQIGSTGMGLALGAAAHNLTESQFGLASTAFRWNVSGSYQQVIPRYVSFDASGGGEREFLNGGFPDMKTLAGAIFRKGYEWPFDAAKARNYGSSLIDLLVYRETVERKRRVCLDFKRNPSGSSKYGDFSIDILDDEVRTYLGNCGALQARPIERLEAMNQPAIDLYRSHEIDITKDPLEIAVCAQHSNGGLKGNIWWESNIRHLFPVGEVNGSHGVKRPGGSALNAGQVGGLRAALFIAKNYGSPPRGLKDFQDRIETQVKDHLAFARKALERKEGRAPGADQVIRDIQVRMSSIGAHIRDPSRVPKAVEDAWSLFREIREGLEAPSVVKAYRAWDLCLCHAVTLEAIKQYLASGGKSRGSFLVLDSNGEAPCPELGACWRFSLAKPKDFVSSKILEVRMEEDFEPAHRWVDIRPVPEDHGWFENVWKDYEQNRVIRGEALDE